jgi:HSP20 family protein
MAAVKPLITHSPSTKERAMFANRALATQANVPDPFRGDLRQVLDRFFNIENEQSSVVTSQWSPRVDILEETERFVILADIPGVEPKDIDIHMDNGLLTVKGERSQEQTEQSKGFFRTERFVGSFHRRFALPDSADPTGVKATGKNGVLEITIPKRPETKPRRIEVV